MSESTDIVITRDQNLVLVATGEVINLTTVDGVAAAITTLNGLMDQIRDARSEATRAAIEFSEREGVRTFHTSDGRTVELSSATETSYDGAKIRDGLLAAGMPEDRVDEICVPQWKVNASKAKQARSANERYRQVIDDHTVVKPKTVYASVK